MQKSKTFPESSTDHTKPEHRADSRFEQKATKATKKRPLFRWFASVKTDSGFRFPDFRLPLCPFRFSLNLVAVLCTKGVLNGKDSMKLLGFTVGLVTSFSVSTFATTRYVWQGSPSPAPPYTNWATAATNIQVAVDVADPGDHIVVTNGVYQSGTRAVQGLLMNRVAVTKPLTVLSVNGPGATIIQGEQNGDKAVRCVYLTNGAMLSGFTLTNGATRAGLILPEVEVNGGGVYCASSSVVISNCVLVGNSASEAGGGAYRGVLNNCILSNNYCADVGGGASSATLNDCTLGGNVGSDGGGASFCKLNRCLLAGNSASNRGGGAYQGWLTNCALNGNVADSGGGASSSFLSNCVLNANSASLGGGLNGGELIDCILAFNLVSSNGAAAYLATLNRCTVVSNHAGFRGGGVFASSVTNSALAFNSAVWEGGGGYSSTLVNCVVFSNEVNSATDGQGNGGGISGGQAVNCTVVGNRAACSGAGGGMGGGSAGGLLRNCIVYFNTAKSLSNCFVGTLDSSCTVPIALGPGNITNEPGFVSFATGNLRLHSNSPCINAGYNDYVRGTNDLDGNARIAGGTVDMGTYEFQTPSSVLSYAWAQQYGLPTDGSADFADNDSDTHNNWQEWRADTVPTNSASVLRLLSPSNSPDGIVLQWWTAKTKEYFVERTSALEGAPLFTVLQSNIVGMAWAGGGYARFTDTTAVTNAGPFFYRVGVQE